MESCITFKNLSIGYRPKHQLRVIASAVSASLHPGELTCLIGANGVGKSTLLRTLCGFQPALDGEILLQNQPLSAYPAQQLARQIGVVLTSRIDVPQLSVKEIVGIGRSPYTNFWGTLTPADQQIVDEATRPFRSPHHTISQVAMVGGGANPQPGEISLAHHGVLFLDELPEFNRSVLEVLRQPLEDRHISISRAKYSLDYPASFMLVASMNPCPCGYYTHPTKACVCSPGQVQKYLNRISGPLLDRIDLQIEVTPLPFEEMADSRPGESSATIRERVIRARQIQEARYADIPGIYCNAQMNSKLLARHARPDDKGLAMLKTAMNRLNLSARAYDRILKVSRTIADLEGCELIQPAHLAEAIGYRNLDREGWAG